MSNIYDNLPQYVREQGLFCCWKYEGRDDKKTKVPYDPLTGGRAKSNDPNSFTDYDKACKSSINGNYDGIGLGIFRDICAIDIDHCVDNNGKLSELAESVASMMQSYTELSPSGTGIRILFQAKDFKYDKELYYIMNQKLGLEIYVAGATSKYVTVTGNQIYMYQYSFGERSENLKQVLDKYMKKPISKKLGVNGINGKNGVNGIINRHLRHLQRVLD